MLNLLVRMWGRLLTLTQALSQLVLLFLMGSICYDAVARYLFSSPTSWSLEISAFLIVYIAIAGAAEVQRTDGHIRVTIFEDYLSERKRRPLLVLRGLAGVLFCGVLVWRGGFIWFQALEHGERVSSSFGTPLAIPYAIIPLGFALLGLQFATGVLEAAGMLPEAVVEPE